jgi:hypothetical protein
MNSEHIPLTLRGNIEQLEYLKPNVKKGQEPDDNVPNTEEPPHSSIDREYIALQISQIDKYGDSARRRLATHLNLFENLNPDGSLTSDQRQAIDCFAIGYHFGEGKDWEMTFPECQYVAVGLELGEAIALGDSWRRGEQLPEVGHTAADNVSHRLNQLTDRRSA